MPKAIATTLAVALLLQSPLTPAAELLESWNDTAPKKSIVAFVERVTKPDSPDYVPEAGRIAVFDNDGTLWAEQPIYFQAYFIVDRIRALAPHHPEWQSKEPFASLIKGDLHGVAAAGEAGVAELLAATHAGMTTDEFAQSVADWIGKARHPTTGKPYTEMTYRPMLELLEYLREHGFKTFIVSGGGIEFMRPWTERVYGIPPEQVIGSMGDLKFELIDGKPALRKLPQVAHVDDKEGKPVGIQRHIGRRPIAAFGNSDGDLAMLQWTCQAQEAARLCLFVHHTDGEREWAYDRESRVGQLDKGLDAAQANGWTVVSMKDDWKRVFASD